MLCKNGNLRNMLRKESNLRGGASKLASMAVGGNGQQKV
jgi:hypothetical protein